MDLLHDEEDSDGLSFSSEEFTNQPICFAQHRKQQYQPVTFDNPPPQKKQSPSKATVPSPTATTTPLPKVTPLRRTGASSGVVSLLSDVEFLGEESVTIGELQQAKKKQKQYRRPKPAEPAPKHKTTVHDPYVQLDDGSVRQQTLWDGGEEEGASGLQLNKVPNGTSALLHGTAQNTQPKLQQGPQSPQEETYYQRSVKFVKSLIINVRMGREKDADIRAAMVEKARTDEGFQMICASIKTPALFNRLTDVQRDSTIDLIVRTRRLLALDPGLGKTLVLLTCYMVLWTHMINVNKRSSCSSLMVTPKKLKGHWFKEEAKWFGHLPESDRLPIILIHRNVYKNERLLNRFQTNVGQYKGQERVMEITEDMLRYGNCGLFIVHVDILRRIWSSEYPRQVMNNNPGKKIEVSYQGLRRTAYITSNGAYFLPGINKVIRIPETAPLLIRFKWASLMADEGHDFRNPSTVGYQMMHSLCGRSRYLVTATPRINSDVDLFYLMKVIHAPEVVNMNLAAFQEISGNENSGELSAQMLYLLESYFDIQRRNALAAEKLTKEEIEEIRTRHQVIPMGCNQPPKIFVDNDPTCRIKIAKTQWVNTQLPFNGVPACYKQVCFVECTKLTETITREFYTKVLGFQRPDNQKKGKDGSSSSSNGPSKPKSALETSPTAMLSAIAKLRQLFNSIPAFFTKGFEDTMDMRVKNAWNLLRDTYGPKAPDIETAPLHLFPKYYAIARQLDHLIAFGNRAVVMSQYRRPCAELQIYLKRYSKEVRELGRTKVTYEGYKKNKVRRTIPSLKELAGAACVRHLKRMPLVVDYEVKFDTQDDYHDFALEMKAQGDSSFLNNYQSTVEQLRRRRELAPASTTHVPSKPKTTKSAAQRLLDELDESSDSEGGMPIQKLEQQQARNWKPLRDITIRTKMRVDLHATLKACLRDGPKIERIRREAEAERAREGRTSALLDYTSRLPPHKIILSKKSKRFFDSLAECGLDGGTLTEEAFIKTVKPQVNKTMNALIPHAKSSFCPYVIMGSMDSEKHIAKFINSREHNIVIATREKIEVGIDGLQDEGNVIIMLTDHWNEAAEDQGSARVVRMTTKVLQTWDCYVCSFVMMYPGRIGSTSTALERAAAKQSALINFGVQRPTDGSVIITDFEASSLKKSKKKAPPPTHDADIAAVVLQRRHEKKKKQKVKDYLAGTGLEDSEEDESSSESDDDEALGSLAQRKLVRKRQQVLQSLHQINESVEPDPGTLHSSMRRNQTPLKKTRVSYRLNGISHSRTASIYSPNDSKEKTIEEKLYEIRQRKSGGKKPTTKECREIFQVLK